MLFLRLLVWEQMGELGFREKVFPATKLALVVRVLAEEGIAPAGVLDGVGIQLDELDSVGTRICPNQHIESYRNAVRLSSETQIAIVKGRWREASP